MLKLLSIFFGVALFLGHFLSAEPLKKEIYQIQKLSLPEIQCLSTSVLQKGRGMHAEVILFQLEEKNFILKNYEATEGFCYFFLSKFLTSREARALEQLKEIKGVPKLIRKLNERALIFEYLSGTKVRCVDPGNLSPDFFEKFYALVDEMHLRGIAHCDLLSKGNVIIGEDGNPYIIDFATSFYKGESSNWLKEWIFGKLCELDRTCVARMKEKHFPELLTETEKQDIINNREKLFNRVIRNITIAFRRLGKRLECVHKQQNKVITMSKKALWQFEFKFVRKIDGVLEDLKSKTCRLCYLFLKM